MAPLNWNPRTPYTLGLEWPGMRTLALPLSQEVEYGHTIWAAASETIDTATFEIVPPAPNIDSNATALVTVYQRDSNDPDEPGNEVEWGAVHSTMCAVNGGTVTAPAALQNAASLAAALATPSDYAYVLITGGGVALQFATAGLFTGKRILELKVHYSATALTDDSDPKAVVFLNVNGTLPLTDTVPLNPPSYSNREIRVVSLGEINYPTASLPLCWPWTVADVQLFDSTTVVEFLTGSPLTEYGLEYVALEVVWCEENRVAVGGLLMGSLTSIGEEPMTVGRHTVNLRTPTGSDNWAKVLDNYYTVTLTSARSSTLDNQTRGQQPSIPAVDSFSVFSNHQGRVAPRLPSNVLASNGVDSRITPIRFTTTAPATSGEGAPYDRALGAYVFNGNDAAQDIAQYSGGGTVSYPWIRFYARIIGDPADIADIDVKHAGGVINYLASDLLALPEIYDGWREVTVQWSAGQEPAIDNSGTNENFWFTSSGLGSLNNRWEILGLDSSGLTTGANGAATYGGGAAGALWYEMETGNAARSLGDLAVTIHTAAPAVSGFDTSLYQASLNTQGGDCEVPYFTSPLLAWTASSLATADFAYYEIQRQDTFDTTWRTIAKLPTKATVAFLDVEARVTVASSYRMRIVRADRIEGAWTSTSAETVPATSAPCGTLYFSSNALVSSGHALAYAEAFDGSPVEGFDFVEAGWVVQQHHYGRYGTQAFHPTERGGVRFERDIVVNAIQTPLAWGGSGSATADKQFTVLRDLAWADIPYVCVKDDLGNRWFSTLIVPNATVQRAAQLFIANIQVIESTDEPFPVAAQ